MLDLIIRLPSTDSSSFRGHTRGQGQMDQACRDGDAQLEDDGTLTGELRFHLGDESPFNARRW